MYNELYFLSLNFLAKYPWVSGGFSVKYTKRVKVQKSISKPQWDTPRGILLMTLALKTYALFEEYMMKGFVYGTLVILAVMACVCVAAPKPAIVPGPADWTVDVTFEHLQQIMLRLSGEKKARRFWYTIITLTNKTNHDVDFYPQCELMTDTFQIIPAGKGTPAAVFEQIKRRHQGGYPFLKSLEKTGNRILQGRDNTEDIAIIWPDFDAKAKNIKLFIAGLSNETVAIDHPVAKDATGKPVKVYLRKTLELSYTLGGDATFRSDAKLIYEGKRWIMR